MWFFWWIWQRVSTGSKKERWRNILRQRQAFLSQWPALLLAGRACILKWYAEHRGARSCHCFVFSRGPRLELVLTRLDIRVLLFFCYETPLCWNCPPGHMKSFQNSRWVAVVYCSFGNPSFVLFSSMPPVWSAAFLADPDFFLLFCHMWLQGDISHHQKLMMSSWLELCRRAWIWKADPGLEVHSSFLIFLYQLSQGMHLTFLLTCVLHGVAGLSEIGTFKMITVIQ